MNSEPHASVIPHLTAHEEELRRWFINMVMCSKKTTTYKFALARFLLEYSKEIPADQIQGMICDQRAAIVKYKTLAKKFFEFYLPHVNKYHLQQDHHKKIAKEALMIRHIKDMLASKSGMTNTMNCIERDIFGSIKKEKDVIRAFQNIQYGAHTHLDKMFYDYDHARIIIKPEAIKFFNENSEKLYPIVMLCWARYLQKANPHSDVMQFLADNQIPHRNGIEKELIRCIEKLVSDDLEECKTMKEYCKKTVHVKESLFLVSKEQKPISNMFGKTVKKPINPNIIRDLGIPSSVRKRVHVSVFGVNRKYSDMWNSVKTGDMIIFFDKTEFFAYAKVIAKQQNKSVSKKLWNFPKENYLIFLSKLDPISMNLADTMDFFIDINNVQNHKKAFQKAELQREDSMRKKFESVHNAIRSYNEKSIPVDAIVTTESRIVEIRHGQGKFRKNVLENFRSKCALCDITDRDLLEAAHIIPFKDDEYRGRTSNGICLCAIHHTMFDRKYFAIDKNYNVFVSRKDMSPASKIHLDIHSIKKPRFELDPQLLDKNLASFEIAEPICT